MKLEDKIQFIGVGFTPDQNETMTQKIRERVRTTRQCVECDRTFNLLDENDACEWVNGHDCE